MVSSNGISSKEFIILYIVARRLISTSPISMLILNKENSKSITFNFIMNDLNKIMANIKWKKTSIDVTTLGLLMRANLIRKGCQNKLMKGISSIQKGLMIYYMIIFMSGGIPKQI